MTTTTTGTTTLKTGVKTTEFWVTAIAQLAGLFTLFSGLDVSQQATGAVRGIGGAIAALSALGYALSRGLAKKGALTGTVVVGEV